MLDNGEARHWRASLVADITKGRISQAAMGAQCFVDTLQHVLTEVCSAITLLSIDLCTSLLQWTRETAEVSDVTVR